MYKIEEKEELNAEVVKMRIRAPLIAKKAKAGQFIILRIDEKGEEVTEISRTKGSLTFATPVPDSGFALSRKGMTHLPGRGFGDNFSPYFVLDVYYNGKRIDNYTVTAAANAPFTASVQADGTLLLLKTGRGHAQFIISYQGQSADFGLFVS